MHKHYFDDEGTGGFLIKVKGDKMPLEDYKPGEASLTESYLLQHACANTTKFDKLRCVEISK